MRNTKDPLLTLIFQLKGINYGPGPNYKVILVLLSARASTLFQNKLSSFYFFGGILSSNIKNIQVK